MSRDAEAVGAPPYALPVEDGGEAATVGHPAPPESLKASATRGDTSDLDVPYDGKGGPRRNVNPVVEDRLGPADPAHSDPAADTAPEKKTPTKRTAGKRTARKA